MSRTAASATVVALTTAAWVFGQSSTAPLTFEVASIKPSAEAGWQIGIQRLPGGGMRASGATLKILLATAYDVREFQIVGGPGWISSDRYDILAKAAASDSEIPAGDRGEITEAQANTAFERMQQRMQALLAERFQLKIHRETKEQPVYALLVGKNGAKLEASPIQDGRSERRMMMGHGMINAQGVDLQMLVSMVARELARPVLDRTGLTGRYDIKLQWTPDPGQSVTPHGGAPSPGVQALPPPDPDGPSLFTAIQEQLGLRLESQKGPVEMIVIDRVEKPSEN